MVWPLLLAAGGIGAFVGSQIDDKLEDVTVPATSPERSIGVFDVVKVVVFAGVAYGVYQVARRNGVLR